MVEHYGREPELFRSLRILKLDEWGGLEMNDPSSCEGQLRDYLIEPLGVSSARYISFTSNPANPPAECARVGRLLKEEGPIDLCVLGLGMNGHIAMNEPAASLQPWTHIAQLAESTLRHPMLTGSRTVPTYGLTLGMAEILSSREILLLVSGTNKREPLKCLLKREITTNFPASLLWLHPNCTLLCDREASAGLDL
jgi:galactosamine-6-phosphate isomerase